jgi:hypothetical protein
MQIGWGTMLVECVLLKMKFTNEVKEIDVANIPHIAAELNPYHVGIVEGVIWDEREQENE